MPLLQVKESIFSISLTRSLSSCCCWCSCFVFCCCSLGKDWLIRIQANHGPFKEKMQGEVGKRERSARSGMNRITASASSPFSSLTTQNTLLCSLPADWAPPGSSSLSLLFQPSILFRRIVSCVLPLSPPPCAPLIDILVASASNSLCVTVLLLTLQPQT